MGIVEFLTVRLDEDEAIARKAAEPESWVELNRSPRPDWYVQAWADPDRMAVVADPESSAYHIAASLQGDEEETAEARMVHIARHDPARVLAEVAAKRAILVLHPISSRPEEWGDVRHHPDQDWPHANYMGQLTGGMVYSCGTCDAGVNFDADGPLWRAEEACETVRWMAAPYDQHPDYDPAWRVG